MLIFLPSPVGRELFCGHYASFKMYSFLVDGLSPADSLRCHELMVQYCRGRPRLAVSHQGTGDCGGGTGDCGGGTGDCGGFVSLVGSHG